MRLIQKVDPNELLCKLTELAEMFLAHGGNNHMYTKIAVGIYKSVLEELKGNWVHLNAFIAMVSPQLLSAGLGLPPPDPGMFQRAWPKPSPLQTPEQLCKRLYEETGITFTGTKWLMPEELPQQWDGLLTYLRDAALLNPADPNLVTLIQAACRAVYYPPVIYTLVAGNFPSITTNWVRCLEDMGSSPELDQLRRDFNGILTSLDF